MSAPSSAHILASFTFVTPQILICVGVIMETTNRHAFGRVRHSVTAVPGFWMPLGRAARECRPYLSSAWVLQSSHHSSFDCVIRLRRLNRAMPFPGPLCASALHL